ncbi:zinc finger CCCH domain-containing protein 3 isoform X1 [Senna tora]|uniref:Zinc finger CCCH domain-containing protein 3 isoform X1 n=1 Tax=Senna tora TaxID=362788 RepID=A0A834T4F1_9FABA|nr:zinc finger CCCH domain-containing protein 3 isoform X1 [Senna tora]
MPENRQVQKNATPNQSGDNVEEAIWRLKINDSRDRNAVAQSTQYPDRPGEPDCLYYLRTGLCGYGNNCQYNHPAHIALGAQYAEELPERIGQPDCGYFLKTGTCKYGSTCKYHHPRDRRGAAPVSFNVLGLPMRQEEKSCPYYMRTGSCKFGVACKFHHPQPASFGPAPTAGSPGPTVMTSSGLPYVGGVPAWSLPRMSYLSGQSLQSYVPAFLSSPPGIIPTPSWNNYMVCCYCCFSFFDKHGLLFLLNALFQSININLSESIPDEQVNLSSMNPTLPERPDQPECRYFMSTGTCKYGSDCKYHHPKERVAQSTINPLGLPVRPGQAICSYYRTYGICKYGPTCKFDHPVLAIPQNYGMNPPALSVLDTSFISNPTNLSTIQPSETSPSKLSSDKHSDTKSSPEDSSKQADITQNSFPASTIHNDDETD